MVDPRLWLWLCLMSLQLLAVVVFLLIIARYRSDGSPSCRLVAIYLVLNGSGCRIRRRVEWVVQAGILQQTLRGRRKKVGIVGKVRLGMWEGRRACGLPHLL
jgi:hypothetical protein